MEDKLEVVDIFYSLQGEGYRQGQPTLFVRFSGCNLSCDFCDETLHKLAPVTSYSVDRLSFLILSLLRERSCTYICFTGGEPLLQKSLGKLIEVISSKFSELDGKEWKGVLPPDGLGFQIETNGTLPLSSAGIDYNNIDVGDGSIEVAIAPKLGEKISDSWLYVDQDYEAIKDVKVVLRSPTADSVLEFLEFHFGEDFDMLWCGSYLWLQPINLLDSVDTFELYKCVDAIWKLSERGYSFGISSQIHKFINLK